MDIVLAKLTDKEKFNILRSALQDLVSHMGNVVEPRGHEDVRLRKHPLPCRELDFCVMHDMERRVRRAQRALDMTASL